MKRNYGFEARDEVVPSDFWCGVIYGLAISGAVIGVVALAIIMVVRHA